jgi:hypothetical protein
MITDIYGRELYIGGNVIWHDPDEEHRDLTRIWHVDSISADEDDAVVLISDECSQAEVFPHELENAIFDFSSCESSDIVKCCNCGAMMYIDTHEDVCPRCDKDGCLSDVEQNVDY